MKYKVKGLPQAKSGRTLDIEKAKKNPLWKNVSDSVKKAAKKFNLDEDILLRQLLTENEGLSLQAASDSGAIGLPQFMPGTAKQYGLNEDTLTSSKPQDIEKSIMAMGNYMADLKKQYKGSMQDALTAYNWGPGNLAALKKGKKKAIPQETQNYLATILGSKTASWDPGEGLGPADKNKKPVPIHPADYDGDPFELEGATVRAPRLNPLRVPTHRENSNMETERPFGADPSLDGASRYLTPEVLDPKGRVPTPQDFYRQDSKLPEDEEGRKFGSAADNNKVKLRDLMGELYALSDTPDYVQGFQYQPELQQPYRVSFQDRLNQANSSFRSASSRMVNNPDALTALFAQKLEADNSVMGEQFRTNQQIANTTYNQNTSILNDAALKNISLADQQYQRQAQAKANTDTRKLQALTSIGNKYSQKQSENAAIRLQENLFDYRPDQNLAMNYMGSPYYVSPYVQPTPLNQMHTANRVRTNPEGEQTTTQMTPAQIDQMRKELELRRAQQKAVFGKWGTFIKKMK